ncbi:MAG TPA: FeoB-associated Cys-rich membrane protein [Clostridiales bacterium]|nr:FeoB-associated Cys-rich membrane protein [Clostridiales bacterium]HPV02455.1 FeoB-associated Cys-rich membrane protein [Clostridiales bacterium]
MWQNIVVFLVIGAIIAGAVAKIITDRRKGVKCPGCPYCKDCSAGTICSLQNDIGADEK